VDIQNQYEELKDPGTRNRMLYLNSQIV